MTLLVTGMHRSGTSLAAALLEAAGFDFGDPATMLSPQDDNSLGFWEQQAVVEVNEHVLQLLGGPWDDPPELTGDWWDAHLLDDARDRARAAANAAFEARRDRAHALKDPRFCLTLPLWRQVLEVDDVVHVVREPSAVVASLGAREAIAADQAGGLWLRYVASLRANAPNAIVVRHDDLLREPVPTLTSLLAALGRPAPGDETRARMAELVDPGLWRARTTEAPSPVVGLAQEVFARLGQPDGDNADPVLDLVHELTSRAALRGQAWRAASVVAAREAADAQAHRESAEAERDRILASTAWKVGARITGMFRRR